MRTAAWVLSSLFALVCSASAIQANLPLPPPRPPVAPKPAAVPFVVLVDDKVKEPHLEIPRTLMNGLMRASADEGETETRRAEATPRLHTILAGVALSLALATGGFWLIRSGNRFSRRGTTLLLAVCLLLTLGAVSLWADIPRPGPRPSPPQPPPLPVLPPGVMLGNAVVDFVPKGDAIRLIVSSKDLEGILDKSKAKKAPAEEPKPRP